MEDDVVGKEVGALEEEKGPLDEKDPSRKGEV